MGNILLDWLDPDKRFLLVKDSFLAGPTGIFMMCAWKRALFLGDFCISKFQICFEAFYNRGRAGEAIKVDFAAKFSDLKLRSLFPPCKDPLSWSGRRSRELFGYGGKENLAQTFPHPVCRKSLHFAQASHASCFHPKGRTLSRVNAGWVTRKEYTCSVLAVRRRSHMKTNFVSIKERKSSSSTPQTMIHTKVLATRIWRTM